MSLPLVTVVVPTQGRETLPRLLDSLAPERHGGYRAEVFVVGDCHSPYFTDVPAIARQYGCRFEGLDAGTHAWGYPQIQHGYDHAAGDYILCIGDDDVYEPGALLAVAEAVAAHDGPAPFLFRVELHPSETRGCWRPIRLWDEPRLKRGRISTQNFCTPNVPGKVARWWDDFCFFEATANLWGGEQSIVWREELIARCY